MGQSPILISEVQIPLNPEDPIFLDIERDALRAAIVSRSNLKKVPREDWEQAGIYVLLGPPGSSPVDIYVGKSGSGKQGVRSRVGSHLGRKQKREHVKMSGANKPEV